MFANEQLMNMITSSTTKNVLSRIFYVKTQLQPDMVKERALLKKDRCLLATDLGSFNVVYSSNNIFIIGAKSFGNLVLGSSSLVFEFFKNQIWISKKSIYEFNLAFYFNGDKPRIGKE